MKERPRSKYDAHMDALLKKVCDIFGGAPAYDAAYVSAAACAWAIYVSQEKETADKQQAMLDLTIDFIRERVKDMKASEGHGKLWPQ